MQIEQNRIDQDLAEIRKELQTLKLENRRIRRGSAAIAMLAVGFLTIAASAIPDRMTWSSYLNLKEIPLSLNKQVDTQPVGNVIQVSEIQILNDNGQQVGIIGTDEAGDGIVLLGDVSGRPQVALSVDQDGAGLLTAFNIAGAQAVVVGTDAAGDGFLGVGNNAGGLASTMGVGVTGGGFVGVSNAAGTGGATIGVDTLNVGRLTISNEAGTDVIEAFAKGGNGQIDVRTSTGISIWASDNVPTVSAGSGDPSGLLGDLDNDGDVDFTDFLVFAKNFGRSLTG
jgi:hypothetical protein